MRVCVCVYACMRVCVYACMRDCTRDTCMRVHCMHVCVYGCMRACVYAFMHACMNVCMRACKLGRIGVRPSLVPSPQLRMDYITARPWSRAQTQCITVADELHYLNCAMQHGEKNILKCQSIITYNVTPMSIKEQQRTVYNSVCDK